MGYARMIDGRASGESQLIPVDDEGFYRGDGAFEVVRTYGGVPFAVDEHLARLARSAAALQLPCDLDRVRRDLDAFLALLTGPDRLVRLILTRGGRTVLIEEPLPPAPAMIRLAVERHVLTPLLRGVKSLSYGANMLATRRAKARGFDDALLVTPEGIVLEGPTTCVLWVRDGVLRSTPLTEGILDSITRRTVLALCGGVEERCTLAELRSAQELLIGGTASEIVPVVKVEGLGAFPADGPVTREARRRLAEHVAARTAGRSPHR